MTQEAIMNIATQTIWTIIKAAGPLLIVSLIIGLVVSIFQTVTSIQEQTLTFVPKVISIFLALILLGNWMLTELSGFMVELWSDFSRYVR